MPPPKGKGKDKGKDKRKCKDKGKGWGNRLRSCRGPLKHWLCLALLQVPQGGPAMITFKWPHCTWWSTEANTSLRERSRAGETVTSMDTMSISNACDWPRTLSHHSTSNFRR